MYGTQPTSIAALLTGSPSPEGNPVSNARNRVEAHNRRIEGIAGSVRQIADTLFGSDEGQGAGSVQPARMGESGLLHDALDWQAGALDELQRQLLRLSSLGECEAPPAPKLAR